MKSYFKLFGLAFAITMAPLAGFAQSLGQPSSSPSGALASPDSDASIVNANPFTSASGADKFYQDNSLSGASQPNNATVPGSGTSMGNSNPSPTLPPPDRSADDTGANPFANAAGASKFYQDNSLTGATMQPGNAGILGGGLGMSVQSWATTP